MTRSITAKSLWAVGCISSNTIGVLTICTKSHEHVFDVHVHVYERRYVTVLTQNQ